MEWTHQSPPYSGGSGQRLRWTLRRINAETYYFSLKVNALAAPSHFTHSCTHIDTGCQKLDCWLSVAPLRVTQPLGGEQLPSATPTTTTSLITLQTRAAQRWICVPKDPHSAPPAPPHSVPLFDSRGQQQQLKRAFPLFSKSSLQIQKPQTCRHIHPRESGQ